MQSVFDLYQADRHNDVVSLYLSSDWRPQVDSDKIYIVAASYFKLGHYNESYQFLKAIQVSFSEDINFLSLYAASCRHVGQLSESKSIFLKALKISPNDIIVLNNYSNLLIDFNDYDQAYSILKELVQNNPDYSDARSNFERVKQILNLKSTKGSAALITKHSSSHSSSEYSENGSAVTKSTSSRLYFDPLMFAFAEDEVNRTAPFRPSLRSEIRSGALGQLEQSLPKKDLNAVAADQLSLAFRAVKEGNPSFALETCTHALTSLEKNSELYSCVADAYLSQKNFVLAEVYFLHSIALGSNSFKNNFNLASLACIKRDFGLAEYYLSVANSLDRSNALVEKLKNQINRSRNKAQKRAPFSFINHSPYDNDESKS